jgi:putative lipoprotein (rSAM/lipoprotein system)
MIIIKRKIFLFRMIILLFLILGFNFGCKKTEENKSPHADYIFMGIVKSDKTSDPIKNIKVTIENFGNKVVSTNDNGAYDFEYYNVDISTDWYFKFEDIDSTENGSFENKDTLITINSGFLHDYDGNWYTGRIESDIIITMKSKN